MIIVDKPTVRTLLACKVAFGVGSLSEWPVGNEQNDRVKTCRCRWAEIWGFSWWTRDQQCWFVLSFLLDCLRSRAPRFVQGHKKTEIAEIMHHFVMHLINHFSTSSLFRVHSNPPLSTISRSNFGIPARILFIASFRTSFSLAKRIESHSEAVDITHTLDWSLKYTGALQNCQNQHSFYHLRRKSIMSKKLELSWDSWHTFGCDCGIMTVREEA